MMDYSEKMRLKKVVAPKAGSQSKKREKEEKSIVLDHKMQQIESTR